MAQAIAKTNLTAWAACLVLATAQPEAAAQNQSLVGRQVMTIKWDTEARAGQTVVRELELGNVYTVSKVNGKWLWFNDAVGGWVKRQDVVPSEQAIDHFTRLVQQDPSAKNYRRRAEAWKAMGELDIALGDLNEAIRRNPNETSYFTSRGTTWHSKGNYDDAIADLSEAIRLEPTNASAYSNRGMVWKAKGNYDKAIADYNAAIRNDPKFAMAYNNRGVTWKAKGNYEKAIADYGAALRLDPGHATAFLNRGVTWAQQGNYDEAFADFGEAIRLEPTNALFYRNRAIAWKAVGDYKKAIGDYEETIRLEPKHPRAYNGIAWIKATSPESEHRDGQRAVELATSACELSDFRDFNLIDTLAAAYAEAGDFDAALKWLEKAKELAPSSYDTTYQKCLRLYRSGQPYRE